MRNIHTILKKFFASVTIMVIPHHSPRILNLKIPLVGIAATILMAAIGSGYVLCLAVSGLDYRTQHYSMAEKLDFYSNQFQEWNSTVTALKTTETEFKKLFSMNSKEEVLENVDTTFVGSLEIPDLVSELKKTVESVESIKDYLRVQKDIYVATPTGIPAAGYISSSYGKRKDPFSGTVLFHSGVDISCSTGSPIKATADGIVSYSGWSKNSGNVVVLEHGCGFSTIYAHNKSNNVKVGSIVKRGDILGYVGSTGKSTGPHVHYEVWKNGKNVNPREFLSRRS